MMDTWLAFARKGDPNNDSIPNWPRYSTDARETMIFDETCRIERDPFGAERKAWE